MKCLLYSRSGPDTFYLAGTHESYLIALTAAWENCNRGQFFIDTGSRVPSRETQLGEATERYIKQKKTSARAKRNKLLDQD